MYTEGDGTGVGGRLVCTGGEGINGGGSKTTSGLGEGANGGGNLLNRGRGDSSQSPTFVILETGEGDPINAGGRVTSSGVIPELLGLFTILNSWSKMKISKRACILEYRNRNCREQQN